MSAAVAFVLKGYPRLSETFIAQEIRSLERRGLDIRLISLRHPIDPYRHPVHGEIQAGVNYLPEYVYQEPVRIWRAWRRVRRLPGYPAAKAQWLKDWRRDKSPNRGRRFAQALVLADELAQDVAHIHAHFLHTPASVARYGALLRGLSWSVSAHAKDIWTLPDWEIREKLAAMHWLTVCSRIAREHLQALGGPRHGHKVALNYHGLDLARFGPNPKPRNPSEPAILLSVGRAVAKKGYDDLLGALARLPAELNWRLVHIGGGPLLAKLRARADKLALSDQIEWRGALPQEAVLEAYRQADIFVLASRIADDGDRDGLPNVLMEAQSQGLAVVASDISAIPELILDGETGLLVPQRDPKALAQALTKLLADPALRRRLATAGEARVRAVFGHELLLAPLAEKFGLAATGDGQIAARAGGRD